MLGCKGLTENLQTRGKWKKWKLCVHAVYKKNKIIVITFMMLIHFLKPILALNQNKNCSKKNSLPPPKAWQMFFEISGGTNNKNSNYHTQLSIIFHVSITQNNFLFQFFTVFHLGSMPSYLPYPRKVMLRASQLEIMRFKISLFISKSI